MGYLVSWAAGSVHAAVSVWLVSRRMKAKAPFGTCMKPSQVHGETSGSSPQLCLCAAVCPRPAPLPSLCFPVFTCESYLVIRKLSSGPDDPMVTRTSPYRARPPLQLLKENRNECSVLVHTLPGRWGSPRERWSCSSRPQGQHVTVRS